MPLARVANRKLQILTALSTMPDRIFFYQKQQLIKNNVALAKKY
jgi:hypothetical protein